MLDLEGIRTRFKSTDREVRIAQIHTVGDHIYPRGEPQEIYIDNFDEIIDFLIGVVGYEKDEDVREEVLTALFYACSSSTRIEKHDISALLEVLSDLSDQSLEYALSCIGFTHDPQHLETLRRFLDHTSPIVMDAAHEAIFEIENRKNREL